MAPIAFWGVDEAAAFGTKAAHEALSDGAVRRASESASATTYLRDELGLARGFAEKLAVQYGLDPAVDLDLITDATQSSSIETRLNRSLSWYDEGENGGFAFRPFAPMDVFVRFEMNCRGALDFDSCYSHLRRAPVDQLIRIGTYAEDNPNPRSQHHFHDPERSHGISGHGLDNSSEFSDSLAGTLGVEIATLVRGGSWRRAYAAWLTYPGRPQTGGLGSFDLRGRSAIDRALNLAGLAGAASGEYPENRFSLPDAERYLYRSVTSAAKDERENYLALHFIALGHVLHLLQDQASTPHTRNDFIRDHFIADRLPGDASLETNGDDPDTVDDILGEIERGALLRSLPVSYLASENAASTFYMNAQLPVDALGIDVAAFWDRGDFGEPEEDPAVSGLAERVHNAFFSAGTISNSVADNGYALPRVSSCNLGDSAGSGTNEVRTLSLPQRSIESGQTIGGERQRFLSSPLVPHLARCRYHALREAELIPPSWALTVRDSSVQRDYLELLFPLAIEYGTKFLQHYLTARIEVVPTGAGEFTLRNLTALPFTADADAIEMAYTAVDASRSDGVRVRAEVSCDSGELFLAPKPPVGAAPLGDFTCTLPTALPEPALRADYWIVVRGQLGERGEVAPANEFDGTIAPKDFVVAFDHVQPQILYQSAPPFTPGAANDVLVRSDLIVLPADLTRSVSSAEESPTLVNLGDSLRPALAARFGLDASELDRLDFISPSAEPGGFRVAFGLDLAQAQGTTEYAPNDIWILDLSKSVEDVDESLTIVPKSMPEVRLEGVRAVAWNRDGVTDDVVFVVDRPVDPTGGYLEWYGVNGTGGGAPRGTPDFPTSLYGSVMAGIPNNVGGLNLLDIHLVNVATGEGLFYFDLPSLSVHPWGDPPPPPIPNPPSDALEQEAEFSPDGSRVAFIAGPLAASTYQGGPLYVADLTRESGAITGGSLRRVGTMENAQSPIWSPDGEWIIYQDNGVGDLFAIRAGGGDDPLRLTYTGSLTAGNLTWLEPLPLPTPP